MVQMKPEDMNDMLVLIYDYKSGAPLGTGFIIKETGHFVTAYHVVKDRNIYEDLRCKWKGSTCRIGPIPGLSNFYHSLTDGSVTHDLTVLQIRVADTSLQKTALPILSFDLNKELPEGLKVFFKGYPSKSKKKADDVTPLTVEATLSAYVENSGMWVFQGEIWKGFSGSPVVHPQLGEVMGVVLSRFEKNRHFGYVRSLHILMNELKSHGYDCRGTCISQLSFYTRYCEHMRESFEKKEWPYAIDKKEFVDAFDFEAGRFPVKGTWGIAKSEECVPFIVRQLKEHPVFCVGYYGMGKTTISKFLFNNYRDYSDTEHPIFVSLANKRLSDLTLDNWDHFLAEKMCEDFWKTSGKKATGALSGNLVRKYFSGFVNNYRVLLILDGIDESLYTDSSLKSLPDVLESLPCTYLLTSRKEFYAFFDVFNERMKNQDHLVVELMPWGPKQWTRYIGNLRQKYPDKSDRIAELERALDKKEYGEIPERPLFLKMISDLHLNNETNLEEEIPPELRKNRAAVYYVYIRWKIKDDYYRAKKPVWFTLDIFAGECLDLFETLAQIEYEGSVPKSGAVGYFGQNIDQKGMHAFSGFTLNEVKSACDKFDLLNAEFVKNNLLGPSFFTMIRREKGKLFRFSHKSFCEYLVGFSLARGIFEGTIQEAKCGLAWNLYQTHEVSAHFQDEVNRLLYWKHLSERGRNEYLQAAFEKVLSTFDDTQRYLELIEEVLYYTGKYRIESPKLLGVLKRIAEDPSTVDLTYYRTAHLSLSMCTNVEWCERYIEYLIDSFKGDKIAFQRNTDIQINYYGKSNMHSVLKKDIDKFIGGKDLLGILPLKVFSYFVCLPFDASELDTAREYLHVIEGTCEKRGYARMKRIMNETLPTLNSISGAS